MASPVLGNIFLVETKSSGDVSNVADSPATPGLDNTRIISPLTAKSVYHSGSLPVPLWLCCLVCPESKLSGHLQAMRT